MHGSLKLDTIYLLDISTSLVIVFSIIQSSGCIYNYGVTVWEVFSSGRTPYPGVDPMSMVALLREGKRLECSQNTACSTDM